MKAMQEKSPFATIFGKVLGTVLITGLVAFGPLGCAPREKPRAVTRPATEAPGSGSPGLPRGLSTFLAVSDIHLDHTAGSVTYGQDTGEELWGSARAEIAALLSSANPPRFALFLGDLPVHQEPGEEDLEQHAADIREVLRDLAQLAQDHDVPMLYVPGNNDSLAGNYCPFSAPGSERERTPLSLDPGRGWPLAGGNGDCDPSAGNRPCISSSDASWGWFSAYPLAEDGSLRTVVLNTVLLSTAPYCDDQLPDAERREAVDRQLAWLAEQLDDAERRGERVLLAMHVFPGRDGYSGKLAWRALEQDGKSAQDRFLATLLRHRKAVAAVMTGHSHTEEIRRLCRPEGRCEQDPFAVALSAPGVTPGHDNNPGIKRVAYDSSFAPVDFETLYTTPNGAPNGTPARSLVPSGARSGRRSSGWSSYTFRQATGCPSSQRTILDCVRWMGRDRLEAFENGYYDVLSGKGKPKYPSRMLDVRFGDSDP